MWRALSYVGDFGLTLVVEVPIVVAVGRALSIDRRRSVAGAFVANVVTHPLLWFVVAPWLQRRWGDAGLVVAEAGVVVVEAVVYWRWFGARQGRVPIGGALAGGLAVLANAASLCVGLLVHRALR